MAGRAGKSQESRRRSDTHTDGEHAETADLVWPDRHLSIPGLAVASGNPLGPQSGKKNLSKRSAGRSHRLHGLITRHLAVAILSGAYKPGDRLFGEIAFSERLRVSRTAYREAVRTLGAKGLVASRPKAGTIVNARSMWHLLDPDVLGWAFENEPDAGLLESLYEFWSMLEPWAAALAARERSEEQLAAIRNAVERMERSTSQTEARRKADQDFHVAVLLATGNPYLSSLAASLAAAISAISRFKQRLSLAQRDTVPDHLRVLDAIADGNREKAEKEMNALIRLSFRDIAAPHLPEQAQVSP